MSLQKGKDDKVDDPAKEGSTEGSGAAASGGQVDTSGEKAQSKPSLLEQTTSKMSSVDFLRKYLNDALNVKGDETKPESILDEVSFEGIARYIASDKCKNIVTMAGAGISTSAGIPDFRSPGTGLYDNLEKYNLPTPQSVFDIGYFKENPEPFFILCKELYPGSFKPTPCHYFLKLLEKKNKLMAHFTQNIDTLERIAGLSDDKIIEAHGTFNTGHCQACGAEYTQAWMKDEIFNETAESPVPKCTKPDCEGVVKPDIVFFGESLPKKFSEHLSDLGNCDCLIVMGTSLVVQPFASLTSRTKPTTPRLYINLERTDSSADVFTMMFFGGGGGFDFDSEDNIRDVFWQGTCDDGCYALVDLLGWGAEFRKLVKDEHARLDKEAAAAGKKPATSKTSTDSGKVQATNAASSKTSTDSGKVQATNTASSKTSTDSKKGQATNAVSSKTSTDSKKGQATNGKKAPTKKSDL